MHCRILEASTRASNSPLHSLVHLEFAASSNPCSPFSGPDKLCIQVRCHDFDKASGWPSILLVLKKSMLEVVGRQLKGENCPKLFV